MNDLIKTELLILMYERIQNIRKTDNGRSR